jgi:hypothetical protein
VRGGYNFFKITFAAEGQPLLSLVALWMAQLSGGRQPYWLLLPVLLSPHHQA